MNKFKITYPDANDLITILIESVRRSDLVRFLSSKGEFFYMLLQRIWLVKQHL